jgi:hypothetical protein
MQMATVRLQMANGHEVYFRAPHSEIHQLVIMRHGNSQARIAGKEHIITTEKNVPIAIDLTQIQEIHII